LAERPSFRWPFYVPSHSRLRGLVSLTSGIVSPDAENIDAGGAVRTGSGRSIFEARDEPPNFFRRID
jgi:hypothetical protein